MSPNRRELLGVLGTASASTLLWALGCGGPPKGPSAPPRVGGEVRTWLRDAVARLAAVFPAVHVLAVSRQRTSAAVDVLGTGVARARRDGAVLAVRDRQGRWREQATSELTQAGIDAAVRALAGASAKRASLSLGAPPPPPDEPAAIDDRALGARCERITQQDGKLNSRIVYAAALVDVDDARVWSIAPSHDLEQRLVRVREQAIRAAWNGTRPVATLAERGWTGGLGDQELGRDLVEQATEDALRLMTPGAFEDAERVVVLDPAVAASLVDAAARALWTSAAARRPEVRRRAHPDAPAPALPAFLTITDDPTAPGAYGGFRFDDEGVPAAPLVLVAAGRQTGVLADRAAGPGGRGGRDGRGGRGRRPGHIGAVEPAPSHLQLAPGPFDHAELRDEGLILEGALGATVDPGTGRVVVGCARARELKGGEPTGRVYADIELAGELDALLGNITGLGKDAVALPYRDEASGEPRWRSVLAPHVRTRGFVRARRRRA